MSDDKTTPEHKAIERFYRYSSEYQTMCFNAWYLGGRPTGPSKILAIIPKDENGRKPNRRQIQIWRLDMNWDFKADELDARAMTLSDDYVVTKKTEMLKRHADNANSIAMKALTALVSGSFDTSAAAVNAYFRATEEERLSLGLGETLKKLSKMSDGDLKDEIMKQLRRASEAGQVIDADPIPENVDTESKDN